MYTIVPPTTPSKSSISVSQSTSVGALFMVHCFAYLSHPVCCSNTKVPLFRRFVLRRWMPRRTERTRRAAGRDMSCMQYEVSIVFIIIVVVIVLVHHRHRFHHRCSLSLSLSVLSKSHSRFSDLLNADVTSSRTRSEQ